MRGPRHHARTAHLRGLFATRNRRIRAYRWHRGAAFAGGLLMMAGASCGVEWPMWWGGAVVLVCGLRAGWCWHHIGLRLSHR